MNETNETEYILKKSSSDEYLVGDYVFTEKREEAKEMSFKEAERVSILLQLDYITTWIYSADTEKRVTREDLSYNQINN